MTPRPHERGNTERAFTLIELLIVMIIIAILMAVATSSFLQAKVIARKTQLTENIMHWRNAIESCSTDNLDGSYMGCTEHTYIQTLEPSLAGLPICCPVFPPPEGAFDLNGIGPTDNIIWVTPRTQRILGFEIDAWMQDGDKEIWFMFAHWPDGTVTRKCGEGKRPTAFNKSPGVPVPGSRACPTGSW